MMLVLMIAVTFFIYFLDEWGLGVMTCVVDCSCAWYGSVHGWVLVVKWMPAGGKN